ncbi:MAG: hypothetical protein JWO44_622 [Bacteroidetes bacterium]|nr:hypothetical protein [Bacteroidota bacterium]
MKTKQTLLAVILLLGIGITSCKKEKIRGCTTSSADNFKSNAEEDDGSCQYSGRYVFWTASVVGSERADVFLEGAFIGAVANAFTSAPSCGATGALTVEKSWTGSATKSYSISIDVYDSGGAFVGTVPSTANFTAKTCTSREL